MEFQRRKYKMNPEEPTQVILVSEAKNGEIMTTKKPSELNGAIVKETVVSSTPGKSSAFN